LDYPLPHTHTFNSNQVPVLAFEEWLKMENINKNEKKEACGFFYMITTSRKEFTVCRNRKYKNDFLFYFFLTWGGITKKMNEMFKFIVLLFSR